MTRIRITIATLLLSGLLSITHLAPTHTFASGDPGTRDTASTLVFIPSAVTLPVGGHTLVTIAVQGPAVAAMKNPAWPALLQLVETGPAVASASPHDSYFPKGATASSFLVACSRAGRDTIHADLLYHSATQNLYITGDLAVTCLAAADYLSYTYSSFALNPNPVTVTGTGTLVQDQGSCDSYPGTFSLHFTLRVAPDLSTPNGKVLTIANANGSDQLQGPIDAQGKVDAINPDERMTGQIDSSGRGSVLYAFDDQVGNCQGTYRIAFTPDVPVAMSSEVNVAAQVGSSATARVTITNTSNNAVTIDYVAVTASQDSFSAKPDCDGTSLQPGASCTFDVAFTPRQAGLTRGAVTVGIDGQQYVFTLLGHAKRSARGPQ